MDALRAEGIYVNLNLHVGYTFRPSVDGVPPIPAGQEFPTQSKPLHPLDGTGVRMEGVAAEGGRFRLRDNPWYEILVTPPAPPRRRTVP